MKNNSTEKFIIKVCNMLEISVPKIKKVKELSTPTMMAAYDYRTDTLYYKEASETIYIDLLFFMTHELRHKWQYINRPDILENYKPTSKLNLHDYNMQLAEIDANGFATLVMEEVFDVSPIFDVLDDEVIGRIYARTDALAEIYF